MNPANIDLLEAISQTPEVADRYVLAGSIGRAVALGTPLDTLKASNPHRFQDIDLIDRAGDFSGHYLMVNGGNVDFGLSRTLRPVEPWSATWGLYDHLTDNDRTRPIATIPEATLGIGWQTARIGDRLISLQTFDVCGQLAVANMFNTCVGHLGKHANQLKALASAQPYAQRSPDELQIAVDEYANVMLERLSMRAPRYEACRRYLYTSVAPVARLLAESPLGEIVRFRRGTQISYQTLEESQLLSPTPVNS